MVSTLPSAVVIECPKCGTRYQLPPDAIGPKGRKVACAHCGEAWQAKALAPAETSGDPDTMFDAAEEEALDAAFAEAEPTPSASPEAGPEGADLRSMAEIKAAIAPPPRLAVSPRTDAVDRSRQKDFDRRQAALSKRLPLAKVRRSVRIASVIALLLILVGGVAFRVEVVKRFPDLAGIYEAVGLAVNIVGLEFRDVTTLVALRKGSHVMQVDARIYSVAPRSIAVPPVVVTLLDEGGASVYEWSVRPEARDLEPGEVVDFSTQLTSPPAAARRVRLTFTDGKARAEGPVARTAAESK